MLGIMAGMAQKNSYAATQVCLAGFAGDDAARAVSPLSSTGPGCSASGPVWLRRTVIPRCRGRARRRPLQ